MDNNKTKICHLSSAHKRDDIRIFRKQCLSLSKAGFNTSLIIADNLGDKIVENIQIFDVGKELSRSKRMLKTPKKIYKKALEIDAELYHFHDPELLFTGLKLLKKGKKVIFDAHEDLPRQIIGKPYLNKAIKPLLSFFIEKFENFAAKKFTHILTATPTIRDRFLKLNNNTTDINNFPLLNELHSEGKTINKKNQICYVGGITKIRGLKQVIDSLEYTDVKLKIAGAFQNETFKNQVKQSKGWEKVEELGLLSRQDVKNLLAESKAGIVTFLPVPNHIDAQPNKIFEYMSANLPIIGSNFDLWKQIIEVNNCGLCVNPENPKKIAEAINTIVNDDKLIHSMGENGRKAVEKKYNWQNEEIKLLNIYKKIL